MKNNKKSILLIDDSAIQLRFMREMLKEQYEVGMAMSGTEAAELIKKKKPDLVFLDYDMPVIDGKMTLKMLRGMEEGKDIPVVFLTGVNDKEHIEAVLELNPAGYILKPASKDRIFATIRKILGEL